MFRRFVEIKLRDLPAFLTDKAGNDDWLRYMISGTSGTFPKSAIRFYVIGSQVVRNLNLVGFRNFRSFHKSLKRAAEPPKESSCGETEKKTEKTEKTEKKTEKGEKSEKPPCTPEPPCPPPPPPEPPCPPKAPEPPPKAEAKGPQPPPCPPMPQCPPTLCPPFPDPNNPCNYTSPPHVDPEYPNLSKLKANQCRFQANDGVPVFLKRGTVDVIAFQATVVLIVASVGCAVYSTLK